MVHVEIDYLIDWLVFNANFSSISAISWHVERKLALLINNF